MIKDKVDVINIYLSGTVIFSCPVEDHYLNIKGRVAMISKTNKMQNVTSSRIIYANKNWDYAIIEKG
jgi:hypothetical protein